MEVVPIKQESVDEDPALIDVAALSGMTTSSQFGSCAAHHPDGSQEAWPIGSSKLEIKNETFEEYKLMVKNHIDIKLDTWIPEEFDIKEEFLTAVTKVEQTINNITGPNVETTNQNNDSIGFELFKCDRCEEKFTHKNQLKSHIICKHELAQNIVLKDHVISHTADHMISRTAENNFVCNVCIHEYSSKDVVRRHVRRHCNVKPFKCKACKREFFNNHELKTHIRVHTGEKPFECNLCNSKFTQSHSLKVHMRLHTGEKRFQCDVCERKFSEKTYLNRHMRTHTGEKSYECDRCETKFAQRSGLKIHMKKHHEKPFQCDMCDREFTYGTGLDLHINRHLCVSQKFERENR